MVWRRNLQGLCASWSPVPALENLREEILTFPMRTEVRAKCALGKFASRNSFLVRRSHNLHLFPSFHTTRARPRGRPLILKTLLSLILRIANYSLTRRILANFTQALAFLLNTSFCQEKEVLRWFGDGASKKGQDVPLHFSY